MTAGMVGGCGRAARPGDGRGQRARAWPQATHLAGPTVQDSRRTAAASWKWMGSVSCTGDAPDGLVEQLVDRGLPFQLNGRVHVHPMSLCAAGAGPLRDTKLPGLGR